MAMHKIRRVLTPCFVCSLLILPSLRAGEARKPSEHVFMWEAKSPTATVYLLGSIHALSEDLYPLDDRILKAYESSDALVVEANVAGPEALAAGMAMLQKARYPADDGLKNHIPADLYQEVGKRMAKLGLPLDVNQMKPWFLSMTITMAELAKVGIMAQNGIDLYFLNKAQGNKEILELESVMFQIEMFDGFTEKEQELMLKQTVFEADKAAESTRKIIAAWSKGDAAAVEKLLTEAVRELPETKPVYKKLIDDRNVAMAEKIKGYLKTDKTYFVVVGAAHLVGEMGIVNLLEKEAKVSVKQQ